jgi:hypothetical protein
MGYGVGLSAIRATAAWEGLEDLDLSACTGVLDKVPDVDDSLVADVGALKAGVTRLHGVVVILGRVRWVCAKLLCGHCGSLPFGLEVPVCFGGTGASSCLDVLYNITFNSICELVLA